MSRQPRLNIADGVYNVTQHGVALVAALGYRGGVSRKRFWQDDSRLELLAYWGANRRFPVGLGGSERRMSVRRAGAVRLTDGCVVGARRSDSGG